MAREVWSLLAGGLSRLGRVRVKLRSGLGGSHFLVPCLPSGASDGTSFRSVFQPPWVLTSLVHRGEGKGALAPQLENERDRIFTVG